MGIPKHQFTCDGYITNWTLRVNNSVEQSMNTTLIPQITTWRLHESGLIYIQQSIMNDSQLMSVKIGSGVIEYTPSPPGIPVRAGDIVGIRLPAIDVEMLRIKPLFLRLPEGQGNSSTVSCVRQAGDSDVFFFTNQMCNANAGEMEQSLYIPLISVVMSKLTHAHRMQVNFTKTAPNDSFYRYWHIFNSDTLPYCNYPAANCYGSHKWLSNYSSRHYLRCDFYRRRYGYSATVVWG